MVIVEMKHKHCVYIEARYNGLDRETEIRTWCNENVESYRIKYDVPYPYLYLGWCFISKEDAMAFKLRWS